MYQDPRVYPLKSCQIIDLPKNQRKSLFNLYTTGILWRSSQWNIRAPQQYYTQRWKQVFAAIKSAKVKRLVLDLNQRPTIIKHIVNIQFLELQQLWLHGNHIQSIQNLQFIKAQKLVCISLSQNHLSQVKSLAKCKYKFLTHIYLERNKNLKLEKVQRFNFQLMFQFVLEWDKKDPTVLHDISQLAKIFLTKKGCIRIRGNQRIKQQKLYNTLCMAFDQSTVLV